MEMIASLAKPPKNQQLWQLTFFKKVAFCGVFSFFIYFEGISRDLIVTSILINIQNI